MCFLKIAYSHVFPVIPSQVSCSDSVDLGQGFRSEPLATSAEGRSISSAADLNCENFGATCRWRGAGMQVSFCISFTRHLRLRLTFTDRTVRVRKFNTGDYVQEIFNS